jgi:hypothetical protein
MLFQLAVCSGDSITHDCQGLMLCDMATPTCAIFIALVMVLLLLLL